MNPLAQGLGGVVRLLEKATPGPWTVGRFGSVHRPKAEGSESSVGSAIVAGGSKSGMYDGYQENCEAIAAAINFLRTHSAEIAGALRDADEWKPIESAPRDGTAILGLWMPSPGAYTRVSGNNYGIVAFDDERGFWALVDDGDEPDEVMRPDYWRPLPAPPTLDSAMQQGGGGGA